ncbi:MAG: cellulose-binding protein [Leptolyngbyaceae cyanobacterium CSU_1_4]|nr:cellulose-binding protein [Leptolyngbyaceae cyanobacterium CSU_1_4]
MQFPSSSSALAALPISVGTNLNGIADWSTQQPFIDAFKSSRSWITQCQPSEPGCKGGWSTEEFSQLNLDQSGWVKSLPDPADPAEYTRVSTLLFRDLAGQYPAGKYLVLYTGEGTLEYSFDARKDESSSKRGRDVILVTPSDAGIQLTITATDPRKTGNYIRNIRVIPEQYEPTYRTQIFNPVFLERIKKFKTLRFMDWMQTNGSEQGNWDTRAQVTDATYATAQGVPLEVMLDLANRMGIDPWFNMPHQASDLYMTNFAQLVRDRLNRNRKVYVEYSNEVWNWQFPQAQFALQQGKSRWSVEGDGFAQWYGLRTAQMSDIWKQVFGRQRNRVVSVMGTQTAWRGLENAVLDCPLWVAEGNLPCYQHEIDALAIAGYFGGTLGQGASQATVEAWSNEGEGGFKKAIAQLSQGRLIPPEGDDDSIRGLTDSFRYYQNVARGRGLQLVAYEGGQHLVNSNNPKLSEFL